MLGLPAENYKGYVEADATQKAKHIPTKSLFILHGLADLTAPSQHGVALARALTEAGVLFKYQVRSESKNKKITATSFAFFYLSETNGFLYIFHKFKVFFRKLSFYVVIF